MKKYFIVADVHGFYNQMRLALQKAGWDDNNPDHVFVSLGDLLDRGRQPLECLKFVNGLPEDRKILVRGNHEQLLDSAIHRGFFVQNDFYNGTAQTAIDLCGLTNNADICLMQLMFNDDLNVYFKSLVPFAEVGDCIFVHGWIPFAYSEITDKIIFDKDWRQGNWYDAAWYNGMNAWSQGVYVEGKTIYCGHWHTSYGHSIIDGLCTEFGRDAIFTPFKKDGICALDACTAFTSFVNCEVVEI